MNSENDAAPDTIEMPVSVVQSTLDIMNGSNSLFTNICSGLAEGAHSI